MRKKLKYDPEREAREAARCANDPSFAEMMREGLAVLDIIADKPVPVTTAPTDRAVSDAMNQQYTRRQVVFRPWFIWPGFNPVGWFPPRTDDY